MASKRIVKMSAKNTLDDEEQACKNDNVNELAQGEQAREKDSEDGIETKNEGELQSGNAHLYPQSCKECHDAWVEKRFRDIGRHQNERLGDSKNGGCLLWNIISQGLEYNKELDLKTAFKDLKITTEAVASDATSSTVKRVGTRNRRSSEGEHDCKIDDKVTAGYVEEEVDTVVFHSDRESEETIESERETSDLNTVLFYTSADLPKNISNEIRIMPESKIHLPLVESWLRTCEAGHLECKKPRFSRTAGPRVNFLLIDVFSQQIVPGSLSSPFVALSYVWGGAKQLQLTKALFPELTQHQGLMLHHDKIPQTIRDAMTLVLGINERYLWVDCLCIVQDDLSNKQDHIDQMAAIYDAAILTIVACTATTANDPLPGVQPGSRVINDPITKQYGISFAGDENSMLTWTLPRVSHSKRAWTFQEVLLSRRCLYFLNGEVMMQCQKSLFKESTTRVSNHQMLNQTGNWPPLETILSSKFFRYRELVHVYSARQLTFPKDRKDAFTGAIKALELAWGWRFCYCMPASEDFDWALLWTGEYSIEKEQQWEEKKLEMERTSGFPTWSWLSAAGRAWYLNEKESAGQLQPLIDWNHTTVWDGVKTYDFIKGPKDSSGMEAHMEGYPPGTMIIMGWVKHLSHATQSGAKPNPVVREEMDKQASYGAPCAPLVDGNGRWCGTLNGLTEDQLLQLLADKSAELSLVLLSTNQKSWVLGGFRKISPPFDVDTFQNGEFKTVNVMLVKWNERLATRIAVGEMHIDAWKDNDSEPEGDLIRLI